MLFFFFSHYITQFGLIQQSFIKTSDKHCIIVSLYKTITFHLSSSSAAERVYTFETDVKI